jgi:hypothetical protein
MTSWIETYNCRCFSKLAIGLDRNHTFALANGAGKSTLIDAPVLIGHMLQRKAMYHLRRRHRIRVFNIDFGKLARTMPAMHSWFQEQR